MLKLRLSRGGTKKRPVYRLVAADARSPRDGRFIDRFGTYNPMLPRDHKERLVVDADKAKSWLAKGAQPTDRVQRLFAELGLMPSPANRAQEKAKPKAKAQERAKAAAAAAGEG